MIHDTYIVLCFSGDKDRYSFPTELSALHAEFTYFYYPGDVSFPREFNHRNFFHCVFTIPTANIANILHPFFAVPPSKIFVHINPVQLTFDLPSVLWLNSFALNLHESLLRNSTVDAGFGKSMQTSTTSNSSSPTANNQAAASNQEPSLMYMDVKIEAILPRIVFESCADTSQRDRPKLMQAQISRLLLTNIREMGSSRADLAQALSSLQEGSLVFSSGFPSKEGDMCVVTDRILTHVAAADVLPNIKTNGTGSPISSSQTSFDSTPISAPRYALWTEPRDVWCIKFDPIWVEFLGARSVGPTKSVAFVDAVPVTLWVHGKSVFNEFPNVTSVEGASVNRNADLHVIGHVSNMVSVQIDHYQFLFLLRLSEQLTELGTFLSLDRNRILQEKATETSMIVGCVIPQVEVTLVMPSQTPGKETVSGECESVVPDSATASLADDLQFNPTACLRNATNPISMSVDSPTDPLPYESALFTDTSASTFTKLEPTTTLPTSNDPPIRRERNSISDTTNIPKDVTAGFMTMKKGFLGSLMTSIGIDSAKLNAAGDDMSDVISIRSDASSDSENFVTYADSDNIDRMFK